MYRSLKIDIFEGSGFLGQKKHIVFFRLVDFLRNNSLGAKNFVVFSRTCSHKNMANKKTKKKHPNLHFVSPTKKIFRDFQDDQWVLFDDDDVSFVSWKEMTGATGANQSWGGHGRYVLWL